METENMNACDCGKPAMHGPRTGRRVFACLDCYLSEIVAQGGKVLIVARDANSGEITRQWVPDLETANRLMVARNRPGPLTNTLRKVPAMFPTWGIETEEEQV
jgi:hypothetical protein